MNDAFIWLIASAGFAVVALVLYMRQSRSLGPWQNREVWAVRFWAVSWTLLIVGVILLVGDLIEFVRGDE